MSQENHKTFRALYKSVLGKEHMLDEELPFKVTKRIFKRKDIVTAYGDVENEVYFMNSGIVEMTIKAYTSEKIIDFFFTGEMFCALTSFLNQIPSDVQITALEECLVESINRDELMKAYENSIDVNKFGRIITEQAYLRKSNREKDFLSKTVEERYSTMYESHSKYLANIPVNKVAKYLGIHPESLSRIRKKLIS
ncbi:Crp/Fnr family transcriptional regulator [Fulvivirga lutea]|uniref:Crp/Fnr family transcriptional regulator n=1 Tax=Fulvivirga lutea TaxID=2810512 RepID=A0A974WKI8_9BACT|nr:Crp/Fnr family transcriptional regulator [Fulvivirga lutea]QSE97850.1 Crp/Fnr family transcriptional regulator [Fulvivirga lutea]